MMRNRVVLPQPDGPISETNSPSATRRLTFDKAKTGPSAVSKVKERSCASITAAAKAADASRRRLDEDFGLSGSSPLFLFLFCA
jgi:hypothetical protein